MTRRSVQRHEPLSAFGLGVALALIALAAGIAIGIIWSLPDAPPAGGVHVVAPRVVP